MCVEVLKGDYACLSGDSDGTGETSAATASCACPAGKYTASDGQTSCTACEEGKYQGSTGTTVCTAAQQGYFASISDTAATSAATGETQVAAGSYACDANEGTPDGVGVTTLASGQCACPAGKYTGSVGQTSCTACESGKYREAPARRCAWRPSKGISRASAIHGRDLCGHGRDCPAGMWPRADLLYAYQGNTASTDSNAGDYACLTGDTDGTGVTTLATGSVRVLRATMPTVKVIQSAQR